MLTKSRIAKMSERELSETRDDLMREYLTANGEDQEAIDEEIWDIEDEMTRRRYEGVLSPQDDTPALDAPWWEYR